MAENAVSTDRFLCSTLRGMEHGDGASGLPWLLARTEDYPLGFQKTRHRHANLRSTPNLRDRPL